MAFLKEARAKVAAQHAARAREEGRTVLVFLVNVPLGTAEGTPVSGVAEQIEAVEAQGWYLASLNGFNAKSMVALFRRQTGGS
jgi:hypothetical protein